MEVKPEIETFAKIKVVGVGGSGGSTINHMVQKNIKGVEFIAVNTDAQALHHSVATKKLQVGKSVTRGLGAGMDPENGRKSAEENQNEIREALKDADMVFVTCGLGGGTGSGAIPVVSGIARELGALTIAVVTKPFSFEGVQRAEIANRAHDELMSRVDTIITIPNDRVLQIIDKQTTMLEAFSFVDDVLRQGVQGIAELVTIHGHTNVDFSDVKAIMSDAGSALMGIGYGEGENRAADAAKAAIASPLLETSIDGAKGILFSLTAGKDLSMFELNEAAKIITDHADSSAKIIYGTVLDESMQDSIKVTVVATGFGDQKVGRAESNDAVQAGQVDSGRYQSGFSPLDKTDFRTPVREKVEEKPVQPKMPQAPLAQQDKPMAAPEDDSEYDIPAFIRRRME